METFSLKGLFNSNFQNPQRIFILCLSNLNARQLKGKFDNFLKGKFIKENLWLSFDGGCSLTAKCAVVDNNFLLEKESSWSQRKLSLLQEKVGKVRETRVRLSPSAFNNFLLKKKVLRVKENCMDKNKQGGM
ncbi:hypothetical protein COU56_03665 [Candidatus Pacearchaeota archaeon CG10_big_fil_rev_8_21_14_0_10_31_9]|nr:MAG: hypothetical protein COU56_03665 [Candidatus Pacearchaeota archaeon CG10_big_fil_rev_8_21_14_0_10_31_9]